MLKKSVLRTPTSPIIHSGRRPLGRVFEERGCTVNMEYEYNFLFPLCYTKLVNDLSSIWMAYTTLVCSSRTEVEDLQQNCFEVATIQEKLQYYDYLFKEIESEQNVYSFGCLSIHTEKLKQKLIHEAKIRSTKFSMMCMKHYKMIMQDLCHMMSNLSSRLSRPVQDIDDIQQAIITINEVNRISIDTERKISNIEEVYGMMTKFCLHVDNDEIDQVDNLAYLWRQLLNKCYHKQDHLRVVNNSFKIQLICNVETFCADCDQFYAEYSTSGPMVKGLTPSEASDRLIVLQDQFEALWRQYQSFSYGQQLFGLVATDFTQLHKIKKELMLLGKLYKLYNDVTGKVSIYYQTLWMNVKIDSINSEIMELQSRCRKLPKSLKEWPAFLEVKKTLDEFGDKIPLVELMANKAMKERHWNRLSDLTKYKFDIESRSFSLRNVCQADLLLYKEDIEDICISAVKEKDIEARLKSVTSEWDGHELKFCNFKNRGDILLRGDDTADIIAYLEDSLMVLSSLLSNRYNAPFRKQIQKWIQYLSCTNDVLERWLYVQNLWVYLEAVFVGGDIAKQLPKEAKRFSAIDKKWVKVVMQTRERSNVIQCCVWDDTIKELLPHVQDQLEICQKSLSGYLEKKRLIFPRFFFVSDPCLLEILGQALDCHTIQAHLLSIFDNTKSLCFGESEEDYNHIQAIVSSEGEKVKLVSPVEAKGSVEAWLMKLMNEAQRSVHSIIREASAAINSAYFRLLPFLNKYPAQVGLLGLQMIWTRDAEIALNNHKIMEKTNNNFLDILNTLIEITTSQLTDTERIKYETLITVHVHQTDIFDLICNMGIRSCSDFEWRRQCRFYFNESSDKTIISITDINFIYQNEYLGCTERLVITPLTDRCYISLAQALSLCMGGSPTGPAGTGKTETTKDMGKALGKYVIIFNCSDQMDYRGLARIFKGLAQSGTWGCFDEFNRIELPVLSVAAQQIAVVLNCKKERHSSFTFTDGSTVRLNPEFGIFLTMNPGYFGRQELPENLKINFRTVAMMVPDRQIIIRVRLASCGFLENITLARKFYSLYKLCEEQLSKQVHYDFGLRNILSVLRTLGAAKQANVEDSESTIVMRVLRDMNLSKLVDEDEPLFLSLINDLFPSVNVEKSLYERLESAITDEIHAAGLIDHPSWTMKIFQLYETQLFRHGIMTLGPSGAGKSCCIKILMRALTRCGVPHKEFRMNPKAVTSAQMFGKLDAATNNWTDGIFTNMWRKTLRSKRGEHTWIVLDGPVDSIWIENLNSVLDDNKTLTLANGDRIPMSPNCKIIFEPDNIDNASPATVSRNGMVYMSSSGLNWKPILQAITLLEGIMPNESARLTPFFLTRIFVFIIMWSFGTFLELDDRYKLQCNLQKLKLDLPILSSQSSADTIYDYLLDDQGNWQPWSSKVENYIVNPDNKYMKFDSILVPNVDNVRTQFLISIVAKQGKPIYLEAIFFLLKAVLLIGEHGTAKTVILKSILNKIRKEDHLTKTFNFSSASTPAHFQRTIQSYIEKRVGHMYGPPGGKKITIMIDDLNMPYVNKWGDQVTNEIVRQTMEMKGFYSLDKAGDFIQITDVYFLAAMIQPGGGRHDIPARLKRHFTIFNCTLPSDKSIDKIFGTICDGYFNQSRGFASEICSLAKSLVQLTRVLWQQTKAMLLPTPSKFHYIFNLRDLSKMLEGMVRVIPATMKSCERLIWLWKHECNRVIADRFTNRADLEWFEQKTVDIAMKELPEYSDAVKSHHYFADFLQDTPEGITEDDLNGSATKVYEPVESEDDLVERLQVYVNIYNEMVRGAKLQLVFFRDAIAHLLKICRVLRTPGGNMLLVGVGGSGKQSLTTLASFIVGYKVFRITLTRSYNCSNFLEDLKVLYKTTGIQAKPTTFIFSDQDIKEEGFLEYMNNILSGGVVANLFNREEQDEIVDELLPVMRREFPRQAPTTENVMEYFLSRTRANLHVALCFSPVGNKFQNRAVKFPGLLSGCTIDWFHPWPMDALVSVSQYFLIDFDTLVCSDNARSQLCETMGFVHDNVAIQCQNYFQKFRRNVHVTPRSYLNFIHTYKSIYKEKMGYIGLVANRMKEGLTKLNEASYAVEELKKDLASMEQELSVASNNAEDALQEMIKKAQASELMKENVMKVKVKAESLVSVIEADKCVAEEKLEAARPALEEAEAALNTIKPLHIATVRSLSHPPPLIMRIMDCVLLLFQRHMQPVQRDKDLKQIKPSWDDSLKFMASTSFLHSLQHFPKDSINEETVELLMPYIQCSDYNMDTAKRVCGDVAGLLSWTKAMVFFYAVNKEVLPLKTNVVIQESRLKFAMIELQKAEQELSFAQKQLDEVKALHDEALNEKQLLVDQMSRCRYKMSIALTLIAGLSDEFDRWTNQSEQFKEKINRLIGDILLATAFVSYSGSFNQEFRLFLLTNWKKELEKRHIPFSDELNVIDMLVQDGATICEWKLQGLPSDNLSTENAVIVENAACYPLLIDPQSQANNWIKKKEYSNDLQVVTCLNHKYFRTHLEDCLSLGRPLLIEDVVEYLDPILEPLLDKNFIQCGSTTKVFVGDKECDVMPGFSLYMTTKLANPAFSPEISAKTAIIDFTVTVKGLEDQLLAKVMLTEKAELEIERVELMQFIMENKRSIMELEESLLNRLASTQGSLVDDEELVKVLQETKSTVDGVSRKLAVCAETEIKLTAAREEYRAVATRGSILYFVMVDMSKVNYIYQTSLKQFLVLFEKSIERAAESLSLATRVENIKDCLTKQIYCYAIKGFYKEHKFLFTLLLALRIDLIRQKITHKQFVTFIKGGASLDLSTVDSKPFEWIPDITWLNLVELSTLPKFTQLLNHVRLNEMIWKAWLDEETPESSFSMIELADSIYNDNSLDTFEKMLFLRCWCPDRTIFQARLYIEECKSLSMGQDQEYRARALLSACMVDGNWLLLQNCHLSLNFCEEIVNTLAEAESIHEDFRLWITTEVHNELPINLLQIAIRFTNESPEGVRASLKRIYSNISQEQYELCTSSLWRPLLYAVAFLHTVIVERKMFGALGWNMAYEFNQADFNASICFVRNHLDDLDTIKNFCWEFVNYMLCEVHYGGRVTDDYDKRLLSTYTQLFFRPSLLLQPFQSLHEKYSLPATSSHPVTIQDHLQFIQSLPNIDPPTLFGLHPNADVTYQMNRSLMVLDTILNIQPKDERVGGTESRESVVYKLCKDILNKLPQDYDNYQVLACLKKMGLTSSLTTFLRQEINLIQNVISVVRTELLNLRLAIDGTIIMNEFLQQTLDCMYDGKVPQSWSKISWGSAATLGFWLTSLIDRNNQYQKWCFQGRPHVFWMPGFFNPQGFLTAVRQEETRAHKGWSLDSAQVRTNVTQMRINDVKSSPNRGVYIYGLYIQGAGWDKQNSILIESKHKVLFEEMPVIHVYTVQSTAGKDPKVYECPIYKKCCRTDEEYIGSIDLKTNVNPNQWILRGVALLCDIK
ncbi:Dynein heavy chain 5, axonemal [Nymphon striatum]|nr:Dynein heavy chain 5, axonemal [Nymphon striatum]